MQLFRTLGEKACLDCFHSNNFSRNPQQLFQQLHQKKSKIDRLRNKDVIQQDQYELLIPTTGNEVDSTKFDITLLMVLLTNFCGFKYPVKKWVPKATDTDKFANIVRVKRCRDQVQHSSFEVSDTEFQRFVETFVPPLLALGVPQGDIDNVLKMRIIDEETNNLWKKYVNSQTSFNHNFTPAIANFFKRDTELDELHNMLTNCLSQPKLGSVICGFPGVGKSETCRQYWAKFNSSYQDIIIWVNCENYATLETEFQDIADQCGVLNVKKPDGNYIDTNKLVDLVYRHFAANLSNVSRKVLFVFDGANDQNLLYKFLPTSNQYAPFILITSQCTSWDQRFNKLELHVFNNDDALQFLTNNICSTQYTNSGEIEELLGQISCHPLALQQVVSYIKKNTVTIEEYKTLLSQHKKDILSEGTDEIGNPSVNHTLTLSINRLKTINHDTVDLLDALAHLDGKEIKKGFLLGLCSNDKFRLLLLRYY